MKIIEAGVSAPEGLADITEQVREYIREVRLKDGFVYIQIPERTCAVTITINDDFNIDKDFLNKINRFLPKYNGMQFTGWTTSNVKASLVGMSEQVMVESGELILGLHQSIYMVEFNGPSTDLSLPHGHHTGRGRRTQTSAGAGGPVRCRPGKGTGRKRGTGSDHR